MELENFFGNKQHDYRGYHKPKYQDSPRYSQNFRRSHERQGTNFKWMYLSETLKNNRRLKLFVGFAFLFVLVIVVAIIAIFLPLIWKLFEYISQNGVEGLLQYVIGLVDKLWKGSQG